MATQSAPHLDDTWDTRALALATDFDELAAVERVQAHHRTELRRREAALRADEEALEALEAHVTQRINELLCSLQVLERATQCPAPDALDFEPYGDVESAAGDRKPWRRPVRGKARGGLPV
jgi:predicted nucleic acid-binding Zn ribbon protein